MSRGSKPGERRGGRQKGVPNKVNPTAAQIMAQYGVSGIEGLCKVASGEALECLTYVNKETGEYVHDFIKPSFDQRLVAFKELAQYEAPKLKSVEMNATVSLHEQMLDELK